MKKNGNVKRKVARKTRRERYEEDVKVISEFTPEEATKAILRRAIVPRQ